jgi:hypothetical protein
MLRGIRQCAIPEIIQAGKGQVAGHLPSLRVLELADELKKAYAL